MTTSETTLTPGDLREGDMVDLERAFRKFGATSTKRDLKKGAHWSIYECATVVGIERETADCIRVDYEGGAIGLPADFELPTIRVVEGSLR